MCAICIQMHKSPGAGLAAPDTTATTLNWQHLTTLPAFTEFYRLIRRLFGMNIALVSPDGRQSGILGPGRETNPFCRAIQRRPEGMIRCQACDTEHAQLVHHSRQSTRYTCHAGLIEFMIPVVVDNEVIALLQCGQVLDRPPTASDWRLIRSRLGWIRDGTRDLAAAFRKTRALSAATQEDLISLLKLIAHHTATAHARKLLLEQPPQDRLVARILAHLKQRFREPVTIRTVCASVGVSRRNLTRLLRKHTGVSLIGHVHRLRIAHACERLDQSGDKISEVALACGFGSIQQFNRVFQAETGKTPAQWRKWKHRL